MGRPPCCDKVGVKKGPWTPEEDIMLVSYVQEHGPGNWKAVPTTTGLVRCSKSCRLRWTNYLRPGIKRGGFNDHEEKMIIQLQALLGNKWAAIASYLPERTDNDIKNYWNTHLKKKLRKQQQSELEDHYDLSNSKGFSTSSHSVCRGQWEKRLQTDIHTAKQALHEALSFDKQNTIILPEDDDDVLSSYIKPSNNNNQTPIYASSTENIAKLLQNWTRNDPNKPDDQSNLTNSNNPFDKNSMILENSTSSTNKKGGVDLSGTFDSLFGFESANSEISQSSTSPEASQYNDHERKKDLLSTDDDDVPVLSMIENWLFSETGSSSSIKVKEDLGDFSFDQDSQLF